MACGRCLPLRLACPAASPTAAAAWAASCAPRRAASTTPQANAAAASNPSSSSSSSSSSRGGGGGSSPGRRQGARGGAEGGGPPGGGGEAGGAPLPLRAALRLLFKRVHPDLFADHPAAKAENERSFKLLQEYLQLARSGDARSVAARLPYRFRFYMREAPAPVHAAEAAGPASAAAAQPATPPLRPRPGATSPAAAAPAAPPAAAEGSAGGPDGGGGGGEFEGLHCVALTLPPPSVGAPDAAELPSPTRKALARLLAAAGIRTTGRDGDDADGGGGGGGGGDAGPLSLSAFLPDAVEALRQAEAARGSDPAVRSANLRGALRMRHQVMVSFADKATPPAVQAALLARVAGVVEAAASEGGARLAGCHIVIGDRMGLDRLGQLCLAAGEADASWRAFLEGVDTDFVAAQRRGVQAVRSLEGSVARSLGVAQVFTTPNHLTDAAYKAFLERAADAAAGRGPLGGGSVREVSLCVVPAAPQGLQGAPQEPRCRVDAATPGVVQVACDAAGDELYRELGRLGGEALALLRAHRHAEAGARELADRARKQLRLRSLSRDPRLAASDFRRACALLLEQSAALTPLLEGCAVRIGFSNRLAPDGTCIELAHNCSL